VVVVAVGTVAFFMARRLPGDPARMLLGPQASQQDVERARTIYALDQPMGAQYLRFWQRLFHTAAPNAEPQEHNSCGKLFASVHVDLGFSYRYRKPVTALIADKAPRSFQLALAAMVLQALLGLGIGVFAARRRGSAADQLAIGTTLIGVSAPTFVLGLALQFVFAHRLGWLPFDGYGDTAGEQLRSLVLPALTLAIYGTALYARITRDEVGHALDADYVRTARAKGATESRVFVVHVLRNALLPIMTLMVLGFGALIGGAIVTERVFRWPGMGAMAVDAMVHRDGPVIFGTVLFAAVVMVFASLILDGVAMLLDPRLRRGTT